MKPKTTWYETLGIEQTSSIDDINKAFREQVAALGVPPDETQLRELIDARQQGRNSSSSSLPTATGINPLQPADRQSRDLIQHQEMISSFDRTKDAMVSDRITPLLRLKSYAKILSIVSALLAAFSFEKINPYIESMLQSEYEIKLQIITDKNNEVFDGIELEILLTNPEYNELKPNLDNVSISRKFEALHRIADTEAGIHLIFGTEELDQLQELVIGPADSKLNHDIFGRSVCDRIPVNEDIRSNYTVGRAHDICKEHSGPWGEPTSTRWAVTALNMLMGVRPNGVKELEYVDSYEMPLELITLDREFEKIFSEIGSEIGMHSPSTTFLRKGLEFSKLAWLDEFRRKLEGPATKAISNRKFLTNSISALSIVVSALCASAIPVLIYLIYRRNRQIEWLVENLEDRSFVYFLIRSIFGIHMQGNFWLASEGPNIVESWIRNDLSVHAREHHNLSEFRSILKSNLDSVRFHRLFVSSAIKAGCVSQGFQHIEGDMELCYSMEFPGGASDVGTL